MAENKFIAQLKGKTAPGSVLEVQDNGSKTSFANMPSGTSDAIVTYTDRKNNATAVLKGAMNWKVIGNNLNLSANVSGDGNDYTGEADVSGISDSQGNNLWINASYTVPADGLFLTKNTKWVLKLCGDNLIVNGGDTVEFTVLITFGNSTNITKKFFVSEQANQFCKELVIDFAESNTSSIKLDGGDIISLKLLCDIPNASARIYQGMTTLTLLQRAVDAENVISKDGSYEDVWEEINKKVNIDGSSIMTGPLKFRAGSFEGAIAGGLGDGISVYKLKADESIDSEVASLTKDNGFVPGTNNAMDIGKNNLKWKDLYVSRVITGVLNNGANINVPTVAGTLARVEDIENKITNCITEIPQDIKLEVNESGSLILKSGSKVYIPDGNGVFTPVTFSENHELMQANADNATKVLVIDGNGNIGWRMNLEWCFSGSTAPTTYEHMLWYDTDNNLIKITDDYGSTWSTTKWSFPICIAQRTATTCIIDQVFNGFGWVGTKVFVLPGVKGLAPNGRNADGTLNNTVVNITSVKTADSYNDCYLLNNAGISPASFTNYVEQEEQPSFANGAWYQPSTNIMYAINNSVFTRQTDTLYAFKIFTAGVGISAPTGIKIKQAFRAVDYSDTEFISNQSMPSGQIINLTLGATGNTYTAPADGYLTIAKASGASGEWFYFRNNNNGINIGAFPPANMNARVCIPVSKGDVVTISYTLTGSTLEFKFVYANGAI